MQMKRIAKIDSYEKIECRPPHMYSPQSLDLFSIFLTYRSERKSRS